MKIIDKLARVAEKDLFALEQMLETIPASRNALSAALGDDDFDSLRQVSRVTRTTLGEVSVLRERLRAHFCCPEMSDCANALAPGAKTQKSPKPPPLRFDVEMQKHTDAAGLVSRDSLLSTLATLRFQGVGKHLSAESASLLTRECKSALRALHEVCPSLALDGAFEIERSTHAITQSKWMEIKRTIKHRISLCEHANSWSMFCCTTMGKIAGFTLGALAAGPSHSAMPLPPSVRLGALLLLGGSMATWWHDSNFYLERFCAPHLVKPAHECLLAGAMCALICAAPFWLAVGMDRCANLFGDRTHGSGAISADGFILVQAVIVSWLCLNELQKPLRKPPLDGERRLFLSWDQFNLASMETLEGLWQKAPHQGRDRRIELHLQQTQDTRWQRSAELLTDAQASGDYEAYLIHTFRNHLDSQRH